MFLLLVVLLSVLKDFRSLSIVLRDPALSMILVVVGAIATPWWPQKSWGPHRGQHSDAVRSTKSRRRHRACP